jgi:hypothetical protein
MATLTTIDAFLKLNYGNKDRVQRLQYSDFPFLGGIKKKVGAANASGSMLIAPVLFSNVQSMGATLATAQAASITKGGSTKSTKWTVPYGDYSAAVVFERKMLKLSASDIGCYLDIKKEEIDSLYTQWSATFSWYLLNAKNRALGSFTESTGVCTMTHADDIVNIQPGMLIVASANDGSSAGHTLIGAPSIGYVIGVNPNAGTFTVSATDGGAAGTPTSWTGTMYAFRNGDFGGSGATTICDGFADWCPSSDPSATAFNGVDRTQNITALSGVRLTAAEVDGLSTEQRIKRLCTRMAGRGFGAPDAVYLNPEKWQDVADGLESRGVRDLTGKDATFGYETIRVSAGGRQVTLYSDRFVPIGAIYALKRDAFALHTPEEFPAVVNDDGLTMLRKTASNDFELRLSAYPATLGTPGYFGRAAAA